MKSYFLRQESGQEPPKFLRDNQVIEFDVKVEDLLDNASVVGFDSMSCRSFMAKFSVKKQVPIVFAKTLPDYPCCLILPPEYPVVDFSKEVWFIGGRGLGSFSELKLLSEMANECYAKFGVTRAIVDLGWAPTNLQIGQGGIKLKSGFVIAVGVSGAIQHLEGLGGEVTIFAINSDPKAEIFRLADYGMIGDWHEVKSFLPKLFKNKKGEYDDNWSS